MTTCKYCGSENVGSCDKCGASLSTPTSSLYSSNQPTDLVNDYVEFVKQYAPFRGGVFYTLFVWSFLIILVSVVYVVMLLVGKDGWTEDRWRVYTLLVLFAPLGLYGIYQSKTIPVSEKRAAYGVTIIVVIFYLLFGH
jgi:hypothetical protein